MRLFKRKAAPVTRYSATQRLLTDWLDAGNLAVVLADNPQEYDALKGNPGLLAVTGDAEYVLPYLEGIQFEVRERQWLGADVSTRRPVLVLVDGIAAISPVRTLGRDGETGDHNAAMFYVRTALQDIARGGRFVGVRVLMATSRADVAVTAPGLLKANLEARILGRDAN